MFLENHEGLDRVRGKDFAAFQESQLDEELGLDDVAAGLFDEFRRGCGGASCRQEIVDEGDTFARAKGIEMNFDGGFRVLEFVGQTGGLPGQLAFLANGDKAEAEPVCDGGAEEESSERKEFEQTISAKSPVR